MKDSLVLCFDYRLHDQEFTPKNFVQLRKTLIQYFKPSSFVREHAEHKPEEHISSSMVHDSPMDSNVPSLFAIPFKKKDENPRAQHGSYISALWKLRDQVSLHCSCTQMNSSIGSDFLTHGTLPE